MGDSSERESLWEKNERWRERGKQVTGCAMMCVCVWKLWMRSSKVSNCLGLVKIKPFTQQWREKVRTEVDEPLGRTLQPLHMNCTWRTCKVRALYTYVSLGGIKMRNKFIHRMTAHPFEFFFFNKNGLIDDFLCFWPKAIVVTSAPRVVRLLPAMSRSSKRGGQETGRMMKSGLCPRQVTCHARHTSVDRQALDCDCRCGWWPSRWDTWDTPHTTTRTDYMCV